MSSNNTPQSITIIDIDQREVSVTITWNYLSKHCEMIYNLATSASIYMYTWPQ